MRTIRILFGLLAILGIGATASVTGSREVLAAGLDLRLIPFTAEDCVICDVCAGGHVAPLNGAGTRFQEAGAHSTCSPVSGPCADWHATGCKVEDNFQQEFPKAWERIASASGEELRLLIHPVEEGAVRYQYNADRHSVQFFGCDDSIIANLPLTKEQLESLDP